MYLYINMYLIKIFHVSWPLRVPEAWADSLLPKLCSHFGWPGRGLAVLDCVSAVAGPKRLDPSGSALQPFRSCYLFARRVVADALRWVWRLIFSPHHAPRLKHLSVEKGVPFRRAKLSNSVPVWEWSWLHPKFIYGLNGFRLQYKPDSKSCCCRNYSTKQTLWRL